MNILITGVAGLIGSHLSDALLEQGHYVYGIDDLSFGSMNNLKKSEKYKSFNFLKLDAEFIHHPIAKHLLNDRIDIVFHLAAYKKIPQTYNDISIQDIMTKNVTVCHSILTFCKKNNIPLIFSSTSDVYGNSTTFDENDPIIIGPPTIPRYSYAISKLYEEQLIMDNVYTKDIKAVIARIFGCFSHRSNPIWSGGHIPNFIHNCLTNNPILIYGDGTQTRAMSYVTDIVDGLILMMENIDNINGEIINIGSTEEMSVYEQAKMIKNLTNSNSLIVYESGDIYHGKGYTDIQRRYANIEKAKKLIGYKNKITFKDGLIKTITANE